MVGRQADGVDSAASAFDLHCCRFSIGRLYSGASLQGPEEFLRTFPGMPSVSSQFLGWQVSVIKVAM